MDSVLKKLGIILISSLFAFVYAQDNCGSAIDLGSIGSPYSSTTSGANNDFSNCSMGSSEDHIFYIDVPVGSTLQIGQTTNGYDSRHRLAYGGACPGTTEIVCQDDPDISTHTWQNCTGSAQRVYWIQAGYSTSDGSYTLAWTLTAGSCPGNPDDCGSAVDLATLTSPHSSSTTGAANDFSVCSMGSAEDHIYYIDVPVGSTLEIGQTTNNYDSRHRLAYGGGCPGSTEILCQDDPDIDTYSWQNCTGSAQRVYYIQSGYSASDGDYTIEWSLTAGSCPVDPDDCGSAVDLSTLTSPYTNSTAGANNDFSSCGGSAGDHIYYMDVPNGSTFEVQQTSNDFDSEQSLSYGGACPGSTTLECSDWDTETFTWQNCTGSTQRVYWINDGWSTGEGTYTFEWSLTAGSCPTPLANDDCGTATAFPAIPTDGTCSTLTNQTNANATASGVTPTGACTTNWGTPDDDVWFSFVATTSIVYLEATYVSGTSDIYWQVFSTSCAGTMTSILCTDDNAGGTLTGLNIGDTYYIRMYNYYSSTSATVQDICLHGPIPGGAGCAGATNIAALPYSQTGVNTSGSGDNFDNNDACGSFYMNGDDYVFEYTPATDECIDIVLSNTSSWVGVFLTDLCPDDALANCVDYGTSSSGNPSITDVSLNGGTTYYITVSTNPSPQTTMFDIDIQTVACPTPPDNDDCVDATPFPTIPTGGGCAQLLNQSNVNALPSGVSPTGACSSNSGTPDDDVWFSFVATEATLYLEATYLSGTSDIYFQVFEANCAGSMTSILCTDNNTGGTMSGLTIGNTYYVRMYCYSSGVSPTYQDLCIHGAPAPVPGQDCTQPLILCSSTMTIGNPGYSGTGTVDDFSSSGNCTGGEKNSMWLQVNIAATGDLNFTIMPNDGSNNSNGAETDYDFLLWKMSGSGTTTDCPTISSSSGTALAACNYDSDGVTGVAPGGNAPAPINSWFDAAFEPTVNATAGDVFYLVIQNFSGSTQGFTVDFTSSGAGVVDYTPPTTIFWTGGIDDVWTDHENWGNCSVTPLCGVDAVVTGTVTNQPIIPTGDIRYVEDITINANAILTLDDNAELHVCGDFTNYGNIVFGDNSTIYFDGAGSTQNIYGNCTGANDFGHFVINKTGGEVILNCNIEIASDFTTSNNTSVLNTNGYAVTVGGDFNNFNGNTTYSNTGTTGTLTFDGTGAQNYDQGASQLDLNDIVMNNTGAGVTLLTNMYAKTNTGSLTLTDGIITTNAFEVYIQNDAPNAVLGHSVDSYVRGNLRREIQSLGSYDFPVGNATKEYQNANVEFIEATSINNLLAWFDVYPGAIPTQGGSECSTDYNIENEDNGYWSITADANSLTGKYNVTLYPTNATNTGGASGWTVTKKPTISTGTWGLNGKCVPSSTAAIVMRDSLQGFSVFGAAQSTVPLPLTLVNFDGKVQNNTNYLFWETAAEINSDYFVLLKSEDGVDFEQIAEIEAAGQSNTMRYYDFVDYEPFEKSFYKLGLIDQNGSGEYSDVILLERNNDLTGISVFPNPNNGDFDLSIRANRSMTVSYKVMDYTGRLVRVETLNLASGQNQKKIDLSAEANGIYTLIIFDENNVGIETIKVLKQK